MVFREYGAIDKEKKGRFDPDIFTRRINEENFTHSDWIFSFFRWVSMIGVIISVVVFGVVSFAYFHNKDGSSSSEVFLMSAMNTYGNPKSATFPYPFLESALLAEPYKTTLFAINNTRPGCSYVWNIAGPMSDPSRVAAGMSLDGTFEVSELEIVGEYVLSITETDCPDNSIRLESKTIWVKYIRRELSSLTVEDRETFLDALVTLWNVNTVEGMKLYGSRYKSLHYFASVHNDAGGNSVCDEFHGSSGFANNHLMLGNYLEQSLQLVDPTTCLHYMDYSKYFENASFTDHLSNQNDGGAWTPILTATWFGTNDPVSGRILNGRWANMSVPRVDDDFYVNHGIDKDNLWFPYSVEEAQWYEEVDDAHLYSPYGLLRSPWNWNPDPYLTRFNNLNQIPDISYMAGILTKDYRGVYCNDYEDFVTRLAGQPWSQFLIGLEDDVHGKFHFTLGGQGGPNCYKQNQILKEEYGFSDSDLVEIGLTSLFKRSYTHYKTKTPLTDGTPFPFECTDFPWDHVNQTLRTDALPGDDEATCTLLPFFCETQANMQLLYDQYFGFANPNNEDAYALIEKLQALDLDDQCEVMNILMSRFPYGSEMSGSGAAQDPLFWVAHGSLERLLQKLVFSDLTSDFDYSSDNNRCSGAAEDGTKYWLKGYYLLDESVATEELTNTQINAFLDPTSDEYRDYFNFVYDVTDYSWCDGSEDWFVS